jgi:hypothetical protein
MAAIVAGMHASNKIRVPAAGVILLISSALLEFLTNRSDGSTFRALAAGQDWR